MQVTVQKIWPPFKPTDDSSNFIGTDGKKYYLDIVSHRMLVEGMTIECDAQQKFPKDRSKPPYYVIQGGFSPVGNVPPADRPVSNGHVANNSPAPPAGNGSRADGFRSPRQMFISEVVSRAMSSGTFNAADIALLAGSAAEAWDLHG